MYSFASGIAVQTGIDTALHAIQQGNIEQAKLNQAGGPAAAATQVQPVTVVSDTVDQDGNYLLQASVLEPWCILCYLPCLTSKIILAVFLVVVLGTAVTLITITAIGSQCSSLPGGITAAVYISYVMIAILLAMSAQCLLIQFCKGDKFLPTCLRLIIFIITYSAVVLIGILTIPFVVTYIAGLTSRRSGSLGYGSCQFVHVIAATLGVVIGFGVLLSVSSLIFCYMYAKNVKMVRKSVPRQFFVC